MNRREFKFIKSIVIARPSWSGGQMQMEGRASPLDFTVPPFKGLASTGVKGLNKQGNYSLRRPPKLIISQAVIRH